MDSRAAAVWEGGLRDGGGYLESAVALKGLPYSYKSRFENEEGTTPEELLAAAHAGCFSMALSLILGEAGFAPERLATEATVSLEKKDGGFAITKVHLEVKGRVPGAKEEDFLKAAEKAKTGCPVSKLFNADISLSARLES